MNEITCKVCSFGTRVFVRVQIQIVLRQCEVDHATPINGYARKVQQNLQHLTVKQFVDGTIKVKVEYRQMRLERGKMFWHGGVKLEHSETIRLQFAGVPSAFGCLSLPAVEILVYADGRQDRHAVVFRVAQPEQIRKETTSCATTVLRKVGLFHVCKRRLPHFGDCSFGWRVRALITWILSTIRVLSLIA